MHVTVQIDCLKTVGGVDCTKFPLFFKPDTVNFQNTKNAVIL